MNSMKKRVRNETVPENSSATVAKIRLDDESFVNFESLSFIIQCCQNYGLEIYGFTLVKYVEKLKLLKK